MIVQSAMTVLKVVISAMREVGGGVSLSSTGFVCAFCLMAILQLNPIHFFYMAPNHNSSHFFF